MTGLDFETIHFIEHKFKPIYDNLSPYSKDGVIIALQHDESAHKTGKFAKNWSTIDQISTLLITMDGIEKTLIVSTTTSIMSTLVSK